MNWALLLTIFWASQLQAADQPSGDARPINAAISNTGSKSPDRLKPLHPQDIERLMREGGQLKAGQVEAIETHVKSDRQDEAAWARLLGYYRALAIATPPSSTDFATSTNALPYARTYAAALEAMPFSLLVDPTGMSLFHPLWIHKPCFETVATKWIEVAKRYPTNAFILARAGTFLTGSGDSSEYAAQGRAFLQAASAAEPQNPSRLIELANRYLDDAQPRFDKPEGDPVAAQKALGCLQKVWSRMKENLAETERQETRGRLTRAAFWAGDYVLAKQYAQDWLKSSAEGKPPVGGDSQVIWEWNRNQAIHDANMIQGEIALSEGKIKEAGQCLVEAGKISGKTLTLSSYGPDLALVRDLLAAGERQAVVEFFDECGAFWTTRRDALPKWKKAVEAGETPDFGPGFHYRFKRLQHPSR